MKKDKLLTLQEVADRLRVSKRSVFRYINDKELNRRLEATKVGYWRVQEDDLEEFKRRRSNIHK